MGDGPLDMRMNQQRGVPASEWLQHVSVEELAWVIYKYGEDDDQILSERIAEYIIAWQQGHGAIETTRGLADIVKRAKQESRHSTAATARLTFQAIRVYLNREMQQLDAVLSGAIDKLVPGGRCSVIAFKKKESNAITRFVREHEEPDPFLQQALDLARLSELYPLLATQGGSSVRQLGDPVKPTPEEVTRNSRARSSMVYVLEKARRQAPLLPGSAFARSARHASERLREPPTHPTFEGGATCRIPAGESYSPASSTAEGDAATEADGSSGSDVHTGEAGAPKAGCSSVLDLHTEGVALSKFAESVVEFSAPAEGYLDVHEGELLQVMFVGTEGDDRGWCFGSVHGNSKQGWFPRRCINGDVTGDL